MKTAWTSAVDKMKSALELIADREKCPPFGDDPDFNCVRDKVNCADCMAKFARMTIEEIHKEVDELLRGKDA